MNMKQVGKQLIHYLDKPIIHQTTINDYWEIVLWDVKPPSNVLIATEASLQLAAVSGRTMANCKTADKTLRFAFRWQPSLVNSQNVKTTSINTCDMTKCSGCCVFDDAAVAGWPTHTWHREAEGVFRTGGLQLTPHIFVGVSPHCVFVSGVNQALIAVV